MGILGQINHQVRALYDKAASKTSDFDIVSREKWKSNEEKGFGSMHQLLKNPDPPNVYKPLIVSRIKYLYEFGLHDEREEGAIKYLLWCSGIVEIVCDRNWINPGNRRQCYKEGEAVGVFWGEISECNMEASMSVEPFNSRFCNKN